MIDNIGEQLLSEIVSVIYEIYPNVDVEMTKDKISKVLTKYYIKNVELDEVHPDLHEKINLFLSSKKLEGLSPITLKDYKLNLNIFADKAKKKTNDITSSDIRVYLSNYNHLKTSSIAKKISVLKSFFSWLLSEEIINRDPTTKIKTPKYNKCNPKYLEIDELEMLRESCKTLRQRALVEVAYATACRLNELHNMNIDDIDLHTFSAKVIGKGNKEREVFFSLKAIHHLKRYLKSRNDNNNALFVSEKSPYERLSRRGIEREIEKIVKNSPIKKKVTVHSLRHTWATLSLNNNMDISVIKEILGHKSLETTQIYAHITDENKRYQYRKHLVL